MGIPRIESIETEFFGKVRQLLLVPRELLPQVWPWVEPILLEAEDTWGEYYTLESIAQMLDAEVAQLWAMNDEDEFLLVAVTELLKFPKAKVLNIILLAGSELKDGLKFLDYIELWANKQGASKSVAIGRDGLLRLLKPYGYARRAVAFSKDISGMVEH